MLIDLYHLVTSAERISLDRSIKFGSLVEVAIFLPLRLSIFLTLYYNLRSAAGLKL